MTPKGKRPRALPPSMEAGYFDPPLKKIVTDEYYAGKTREIDSAARLDNPNQSGEVVPRTTLLQRL
ncbi:MAG: hypothetical protein MI924_09150 [Chloroflexales bacterium]|nr:hypothetical protein [Chloroflexales bacterium]